MYDDINIIHLNFIHLLQFLIAGSLTLLTASKAVFISSLVRGCAWQQIHGRPHPTDVSHPCRELTYQLCLPNSHPKLNELFFMATFFDFDFLIWRISIHVEGNFSFLRVLVFPCAYDTKFIRFACLWVQGDALGVYTCWFVGQMYIIYPLHWLYLLEVIIFYFACFYGNYTVRRISCTLS